MVVGGGASGTLAALHLIRQASGAGAPLALHIIEPNQLGRGVAYSTVNLRHRLNVPAAGMSALPEEPAHFAHWLRANYDPAFAGGGFAPRAMFGAYLAETVGRQVQTAARVMWTRHRSRAVDQRRHDQGVAVTLAGHQVLEAAAGLVGEDLAASLGEALASGRQRDAVRAEPRGQPCADPSSGGADAGRVAVLAAAGGVVDCVQEIPG